MSSGSVAPGSVPFDFATCAQCGQPRFDGYGTYLRAIRGGRPGKCHDCVCLAPLTWELRERMARGAETAASGAAAIHKLKRHMKVKDDLESGDGFHTDPDLPHALHLDQDSPLQQWETGDAPEEELDALDALNNQISEDVLKGYRSEVGPQVVLLTFTRSPKAYRDVLMQSAELAGYRQALEERDFAVELPSSGAKILVHPAHYSAVLEAVDAFVLTRKHVLVDLPLKDVVIGLVMGLPGREKVLPRNVCTVPLGRVCL